jgi:DNA-binding beta-propeller fold protein YncE
LVPTPIGKFGYVSCDRNKLVYTCGTKTVVRFDMNGKEIWRFQDTSVLRSPRGVVVDNHGFVFVAGEESGNIVVISPDGNSSKEVSQISNPIAMCYDKKENKILVCHTDNKASWFQTE